MQYRYRIPHLLLSALVAFSACKKKVDEQYDNRPNQQPVINSNTRLINLVSARELKIGGQQLSSYLKPNFEGYYGSAGTMRITRYFPETGQLGTTFTIPSEFVQADGMIKDLQVTSLSSRDKVPLARPFQLKDYGRTPMDYFHAFFSPGPGMLADSMFAIPREVSPAADPTKIRIRLVNLGSTPDYFRRSGPMSLTWADGTPIDSHTSHIAPGKASSYIELPYGTYQFKVTTDADGREVPAKGNSAISANVLNPGTGTMMGLGDGTPGVAGFSDSWLTFAPLRTYQPGGVYTLVVSNMSGYSEASPGTNGETLPILCNSFQLINDISEPANQSYARVQGVNVLPGAEVKWVMDSQEMGNNLFATHTGYSTVVAGTHLLKATDSKGTLLAQKEITLQPGDNVTAWLYTSKAGQPDISFSNNNLSTIYNLPVTGNDGSDASRKDGYPYWVRFMNFCADQPQVTFTENNGVMFGSAGSKLVQYGQQQVNDAYALRRVNFNADILVYASRPGVLPGDWISSIAPLKHTTFIRNIDLYKTTGKPWSEPGVYTVALVGSTAGNASEKARMILIKHTR